MKNHLLMAALLAATAFTPALAQDGEQPQRGDVQRGEGQRGEGQRGEGQRGERAQFRAERIEQRQQRREAMDGGRRDGGWSRGQTQAPAPSNNAAQQEAPVIAQQAERRENVDRGQRADMGARGTAGDERQWRRNDAGSAQLGGGQADGAVAVERNGRRWNGARSDGQATRQWNAERREAWRGNAQAGQQQQQRDGRDWQDRQRGNDTRLGTNGRQGDRQWNGTGNRQWQDRRDGLNWGERNWAQQGNDRFYNNSRNWNRGWRQDQRYNWQQYRFSNRSLYRARPYYAPSGWGYGYRRFSIGLTLSSILFDQRFWIDDPYDYRLPPAYGSYRWVRYYDDVLLVDLRTGQVVDAIHDFFW